MAFACPATKTSERVQVVYVYDGDTVKLKDGRRLRFIGINTPEISNRGKPEQPLAETARFALQHLLDSNNSSLLLQYGKQDHDHYGRLLAHAFLDNGENIAAHMLRQGLATTLVVPPNTWGTRCYQNIENEARIKSIGLWALPDYQPQSALGLPLSTRGYRIVYGQVSGLRDSRYTLWVDIEGPLELQIPKKDLIHFDSLDSLMGKQVQARGWIRQDHDGLRMKVNHPAALQVINGSQHGHN